MADTPARVTRSRQNTPLPAIQNKSSQSYGVPGKANLRGQVKTTETTFASHLTAGRKASSRAVSEAPEDEIETSPMKAPPKPATRLGRPRKQSTILEEHEDEGVTEAERSGTVINPEAEYEGAPAAAVPSRAKAPGVRVPRPNIAPQEPPPPPEDIEPPEWLVTLTTIPRWLKRVWWPFLLVFLGILLTFTFCFMPLPASLRSHRDRIVRAARIAGNEPGYDQPPREVEELWLAARHRDFVESKNLPNYTYPKMQWLLNYNHNTRLDKLEARMDLLEQTVGTLNGMVPDFVVVKKDAEGSYSIPDGFWEAMQGRLEGDEPMWNAFVTANEQKIRAMGQEVASAVISEEINNDQIVGKSLFLSMIKENNEEMIAKHADAMRTLRQETAEYARDVAEKTANERIDRSPVGDLTRSQLSFLVKSNIMHNMQEAMRTVNWFSLGMGAVIDPHFTSPTAVKKQKSTLAKFYTSWNKKHNDPTAALTKWDEMKDCWCASESDVKGKAQIGIITPTKIFPKKLLIEHIPAQGTLEIAAAPKEVEIWADTPTSEHARRARLAMEEYFPMSSTYKCRTAPGPTWLCMGYARYNVHGENWVQAFDLWADASALGLGVNKFLIRAVSNWGADHTCFYRLRLTGDRVSYEKHTG